MNLYGFFYKTLRRIIAGPLYRMTVTGAENVPAEGPVVLCCNHTAMMDVLALSSSTPRQIRFMAKKELFSVPFVGKLVATCGAFPVDRAGMDVGALKKAIGILSQGEIMGIFPQGTRCPGVHPGQTYDKLHGGMAMVAVRAKAAIVPVCIETDCHKLKLFHKTRVRYGKPMLYEEYAAAGTGKDRYMEITKEAFDRVVALYDEGRTEA